jgi:hypothetical protein
MTATNLVRRMAVEWAVGRENMCLKAERVEVEDVV